MANWICNFGVSKIVPSAVANTSFRSAGVFIWFACCSLASVIYVFVSVCETANCTLEQLDRMFAIQSMSQYIEFCRKNILKYKFGKQWVNTNEYTNQGMEINTSIQIHKNDSSDIDDDDNSIDESHKPI